MKSLKRNFFLCSGKYDITNFLITILKKTWKRRKALIKRYDKQKGKKQKNEV